MWVNAKPTCYVQNGHNHLEHAQIYLISEAKQGRACLLIIWETLGVFGTGFAERWQGRHWRQKHTIRSPSLTKLSCVFVEHFIISEWVRYYIFFLLFCYLLTLSWLCYFYSIININVENLPSTSFQAAISHTYICAP